MQSITRGFCCNWAGPGNNHSTSGATAGKGQKQCFERTEAGIFEEDVSKRAITYAPTVSCNDSRALTYDWPAHSGDTATNNLVTLSGDTEFADYTAPTAPDVD